MGHDIYARIPGQSKPIAHLRINGRRRRETKIYTALDAEQFNGKDSGTGDFVIIPAKKINQVKSSIFLNADERTFLQTCANAKVEAVEIEFA